MLTVQGLALLFYVSGKKTIAKQCIIVFLMFSKMFFQTKIIEALYSHFSKEHLQKNKRPSGVKVLLLK